MTTQESGTRVPNTTAAERLRNWGGVIFTHYGDQAYEKFEANVDQALADERRAGFDEGVVSMDATIGKIERATVERIRKIALEVHHPDSWFIAQLDAEADRE
jgi:hypothetical protein